MPGVLALESNVSLPWRPALPPQCKAALPTATPPHPAPGSLACLIEAGPLTYKGIKP
jgi:hypothetical protein